MHNHSVSTMTGNEDPNIATPAILFGFAAFFLMLLIMFPKPAAVLPVLALALMVQLTRLLGARLYRDFTEEPNL